VFVLIEKKCKGQGPLALEPFNPKKIWGLEALGLIVSLKRKLGDAIKPFRKVNFI